MSPAPYRARDGHLHFGEVTAPSGVITGDCVTVMAGMPAASVDLVLTDPPYVCRYRDRAGRTVANDNNGKWLKPAFAEIARLMKPDTLCISFYGWTAMASFMEAWQAAGLRPVAHLAFCKAYSSRSGLFLSKHESAFALAKGCPPLPAEPLSDVVGWVYTGNLLHPTQKPVQVLEPLVRTYCREGGLVLDPFCGSGSTLVAAKAAGRRYTGIEIDPNHAETARKRLE